MTNELISTSKIVKMFTDEEIKRSGMFEITGKDGHQGWAMTAKTKKSLAKQGFTPTNKDGDNSKRCTLWAAAAVPIIKGMIQDAITREDEEEDVGVPCSKEDVIIELLKRIVSNQERQLEKWN